jgi:hypothetical protein
MYKTRFFNSIRLESDILIKSSHKTEKIIAEYFFYYLAPSKLKPYLVKPTDLIVSNGEASYKMKNYNVPDMANLYINEDITEENFIKLMSNIENILNIGDKKFGSIEDSHNLVIEKTRKRIEELRSSSWENLYKIDVDEIQELLYKQFTLNINKKNIFLKKISHGDLCLSNILFYDNTIKLVDPRGALCTEDLYVDEYYDIAKLSHSVIYGYDYINYGLYEIINNNVVFKNDIKRFSNIFYDMMKRKEIDLNLLDIYVASLFISMVPLHLEDENKIAAFLITAKNILLNLEKENNE